MTSRSESEDVSQRAKNCKRRQNMAGNGLMFLILVFCIVGSIIFAVYNFLTTDEEVKEKHIFVEEHDETAIVYFGVGIWTEICWRIVLQPGGMNVTTMFRQGRPCSRRQIDIPVDETQMEYLSNNVFSDDNDFASFLNLYIQNNYKNGNVKAMNLSIVVIEGPSSWKVKDTIYIKKRSPVNEFMHPFYLMTQYALVHDDLDSMEAHLETGESVEALNTFVQLISTSTVSYRMVSTEAPTLFIMHDVIVQSASQPDTRAIETETVCVSTNKFNGSMVNCDWLKSTQGQSSAPEESSPRCPTEAERSKTTYSETMFKWSDGKLSQLEKTVSYNWWGFFGGLVTTILALDRLLTTCKRYKAEKVVAKRLRRRKRMPTSDFSSK